MIILVIVAILLIAAGIFGLVYTRFSFTTDSHKASLGPIAVSVKEKEIVNIPTIAGVVSIIAGIVLLLLALK